MAEVEADAEELRAGLEAACRALKVFPLPGVVVLPGTPTPFHVFEARYRAMTADALAGDRFLAVPMLASSEQAEQAEQAAEARPPVHLVAGAGVIEEHERLPDGRYLVVVRGVGRVRLVEELERGKPYREFRAELLEDRLPPGGAAALVRQRAALEECVRQLAGVLPEDSGAVQLAEATAQIESASQLADLVAAAVVSEPGPRQAVLEELDVARRLDLVTGEVAGVVLMLSRATMQRV